MSDIIQFPEPERRSEMTDQDATAEPDETRSGGRYRVNLDSVLDCLMEDFDRGVVFESFDKAKEYARQAFQRVPDLPVRAVKGRGVLRGSGPRLVGAGFREDRGRRPTGLPKSKIRTSRCHRYLFGCRTNVV
jgi:hypothetical protein